MTVADFGMRTSSVLRMPPVAPEFYAQGLAREAAEPLRAVGLKTTIIAREGEAGRCLINEAANYGAGCIFVGARGLGRIDRFMLGSVSASVAMRAECSVEVIHCGQRQG